MHIACIHEHVRFDCCYATCNELLYMYSYLLAAEDSEAPRGTSTVDGGEVSGTGTSN